MHEFGHAIGLGHPVVTDGDSIMLQSGYSASETATAHDRDMLFNLMYPTPNHDNTIFQNETISNDQRLLATSQAWSALMQTDGNFVLYGPGGWTWASNTAGSTGAQLRMQSDGNVVVVSATNVTLCDFRTYGNAGARLAVQDDGNLVVYTTTNVAIWAKSWGSICFH